MLRGVSPNSGGALLTKPKEKLATHAPDTPNATPQPLLKPGLDSEDGNSSILIERISSCQLPVSSSDGQYCTCLNRFDVCGLENTLHCLNRGFELQEGIPVEAALQSTGTSFHVLGTGPTERGPLFAEVPDGERNYVWDDGSEYFGEWRNGAAQGRGVFSWPSGKLLAHGIAFHSVAQPGILYAL